MKSIQFEEQTIPSTNAVLSNLRDAKGDDKKEDRESSERYIEGLDITKVPGYNTMVYNAECMAWLSRVVRSALDPLK